MKLETERREEVGKGERQRGENGAAKEYLLVHLQVVKI